MTNLPIFCRAICVFLIDTSTEEPQVLLLRRINRPAGTWSQIAGSIEENETAWQAALREVKEEVGISLTELWSADICEQFYVAAKNSIEILPVFLARISRDTPLVLNDEHDAYQWFSIDDAKELVSFAGQRCILEQIKSEFVDRTPNPHLRIDITQTECPA
ncbi:NUDIX domain-containing protein [Pseudovibrio sp. Tun.PSC04-5.I4]|uniref:NUDIX hydrolase n=1 Tax=Pseudovibrio sp. Tun.PSC04-5.I4 TaxID=1798213 RepID=UPI00088C3F1D|nr:NUDIX domain-containing protein [Pseudovibrio sp. Tun.PSC04-5.I4]SDR47429.1 dATP pyrophosphohydrolase [Pseudovibrio sp. Tun.PSC04-5.I4]